MKLLKEFSLMIILFTAVTVNAQVGIGTTTPNNSAALDITSTNKGLLMPRITTSNRNAIPNPATGLMVFDTDKGSVMFFDGSSWRALSFTDETKINPHSQSSSDPAAGSQFGTSVSISGNYAIVGAPQYGGTLANMGLVYFFNKTSSGWKQMARLAAPDSAANDYFGGSVSISGDYAIVGCTNKLVNGNLNQGKAYVYHRAGSSWLLDSAFVKPIGSANDYFGWSVGICVSNTGGPGIAIGIPYSDVAGYNSGEVYCYKKVGSTWSFIQNILPADLANSDSYGSTISMDTDYLTVGAPKQTNLNGNIIGAGAAYIYAFGGGVWNFQQKLSGTTKGAEFGLALSLSSNLLAIGAPFAIYNTGTSASVYIYERTGSTWSLNNNIYIFNTDIIPYSDQFQPANTNGQTSISIVNITFGNSLSLSGNTLLIGASGGNLFPAGFNYRFFDRIGAVYVYKKFFGSTFTKTNLIQADNPAISDLFGEAVGLSGGQFIIGSPYASINGIPTTGNVYFGSQ